MYVQLLCFLSARQQISVGHVLSWLKMQVKSFPSWLSKVPTKTHNTKYPQKHNLNPI